ncbi:MAG: DUF4169 family protein [Alphaproteobacteria bacterium]
MTDLVNLNRFRKQRERDEKARRAAENRAKHGRTKAERGREVEDARRRDADLDGKLIE